MMTLGEVASIAGLEHREALSVLKTLEARGLVSHKGDARRGELVWIGRLDN